MQRILRVISLNFQFNFPSMLLVEFCLFMQFFSCLLNAFYFICFAAVAVRENLNMATSHIKYVCCMHSSTQLLTLNIISHFQIITIEIDLLNYELHTLACLLDDDDDVDCS